MGKGAPKKSCQHTKNLNNHFMKHFAYTTMLLLCLTISKTKAQTSASMGLNGVVESYEISGKGNSYSEYARFNPDTKNLSTTQLMTKILE